MSLLLLFACAGPKAVDDTASPVDDSGAPPASPCGPWAGVDGVGTRWDYVASAAYVAATGFDGTVRVEVTAVDGEAVTLVETGDLAGDAGRSTWTRTESWTCAGGEARWTASAVEGATESGGDTATTEGWRTFDPGWKVRPATLAPGDAWEDAFTYTLSVNGADPTVTEARCTSRAGDPVTVDALGVDAIPLAVACDVLGADSPWLAEGWGMVASEDLELVARAG